MVKIFRKGQRRSEQDRARDAPAQEAQQHPDIVLADITRMDAETRAMYRDAREVQLDAAEAAHEAQRDKPFVVRSPFKFGFIVTLGGLAALLLGQAIGQLSSIILYIVAALFVSLGLDPLVRMLERHNVKRPIGIAIVFVGFLAILGGILAVVVPMVTHQITLLVSEAPRYLTNVNEQEWFLNLDEEFGQYIDFTGILDMLGDFLSKPDNWAQFAGGVLQASVSIANTLMAGLIILILSLYFLASMRGMRLGLYSITPRSSRAQVINITEQVTRSVGGYVNGMVLLAFMNAVLGFIAMTIMQVPFAGLVAVGVFFLALIPLVGSVSATVLVTIVALFNSPITAVSIAAYYLIYMQIEAYVLTPRVMNRVVSVPPVFVMIGALAGAALLGLLGALIAIPVTAMILMIVKQVWIPRQQFR